MSIPQSQMLAKESAAKAAADLISSGMNVGLGTGSTAQKFIEYLAVRCQKGLKIKAIASSERTKSNAEQLGIPLISINDAPHIDVDIDGADEIDPHKQMIKGGGGALLREKILASSSKEMIVIIDSAKLVASLGSFPVAVEIVPYGFQKTIQKMDNFGYEGTLRLDRAKKPFITDNQNYIFDITFSTPIDQPEKHHMILLNIPGVVETGFFLNFAGRVIVGYPDGSVKVNDPFFR